MTRGWSWTCVRESDLLLDSKELVRPGILLARGWWKKQEIEVCKVLMSTADETI